MATDLEQDMAADLEHGRGLARDASPKVLVAEDDHEMRRLIADHLRRAGYETVECVDGAGLLLQLADHLRGAVTFSAVVSDVRMPGFSGLEVLGGLRHGGKLPPAVLITAFGDEDLRRQAEQHGIRKVLSKPFRLPDLVALVDSVADQASTGR